MSDSRFLLEFTGSNVLKFRSGEISLASLTARLEGVADEAQREGVHRFDELIDAWEDLEIYNAIILDQVDRWGWGGIAWRRRASRVVDRFLDVACGVLGVPSREPRRSPPTLTEVRAVLDLFVECTAEDHWGDAIADQVSHVVGVTGTLWYADLILKGAPTPMPWGTPVPISRSLASRPGVSPIGSLILWVDDESGVIDCIEYAVVEQSEVSRYPRPDELEELS